MARAQTTPQLAASITMGSAKIELRPYGSTGAFVDYGLATGVEFNETIDPAMLEADNADPFMVDFKEHSVTIKFDMLEQDLTKIYALRGGSGGPDAYATQAASAVSVTDESHVLSGTSTTGLVAVPLNYFNGDKTVVTSITVKNAANASATLDTDYTISLGSDGKTYISRASASTVLTNGGTAKVSYSYTPLANKSLSSGGINSLGYLECKLTNVKSISGVDKTKTIQAYKVQIQSGFEYKFPKMDSTDPLSYPVELLGYCDNTRTVGDQLFKITDEQGV